MGKASNCLRRLFCFRKSIPSQKPSSKKRWHKDKDRRQSQDGVAADGYDVDEEASRRAIAVAAATAAVAEAAVAAAQAAAAVAKLTASPGGKGDAAGKDGGFDSVAGVARNAAAYGSHEESAAVVIQSNFRAYLSRRALQALKAVVKLQALVRGQILRRHFAKKLQQMQTIGRAQARVRAGRVLVPEVARSCATSSPFNHTRNSSRSSSISTYDQEKSHFIRPRTDKRRGERSWEQASFTGVTPTDDERSDKILEVDTWRPSITSKHRHIFHSPQLSCSSDQYHQIPGLSPLSGEVVQSLSPLDVNAFTPIENSPLYYSASSMGGSSRRGPFTPTKSNAYSDCPSYMTYTQSSKAKVRSFSAPKQRPQYERSSSANRHSVHVYGNTQNTSALHDNFTSKAYPGSGRLDKLGMPVRDVSGFSGGHWLRHW